MDSSPIPFRQAGVVFASPSKTSKHQSEYASDDELSIESIPNSQSSYHTQPTQRVTQPTQLVSRTSLKPQMPIATPSSPSSAVEVPASSPFQSRRAPFPAARLGSLMAPAGTVFRAPVPPPKQESRKRDYAEISSDDESDDVIVVDSSDDEKSTRGDIRPTAFKRSDVHTESQHVRPKGPTIKPLDDRHLNFLVTKVLGGLRKRGQSAPIEACKGALAKHSNDVTQATDFLLKHGTDSFTRKTPQDLIRSFAFQAVSQPSRPTQPSETPPPQPKKRRLVQGRRPRADSSSPVKPSPQAQDDQHVLREIIEIDDDDDTYSAPTSPSESEPRDQVDQRCLKYLNTCTIDELVAMLGALRKDKAAHLISHRPFRSVAAVMRIKKPGKGRNAKNDIGKDIFFSVKEYVEQLQAIDIVVAKCEEEGGRIKAALAGWNVDFKGNHINEAVEPGEPMTPSSADGRALVPMPIPQEPMYMRGHCTMKGYQLYGLNWLWQLYQLKFGCILADDMGLGKTCQVVSFLSHLVEDYNGTCDDKPWPNLVVVPPTTLGNWKNEFAKFSPKLKIKLYSGSPIERDGIFHEIQDNPHKYHVILTSYSQLKAKEDFDAMKHISPNVAIFDEGHKVKNSSAQVYNNLIRIPSNWRLLLTGTPIQNNIMEMINLLNFIQPDLFGRYMEQLRALFSQKVSLQDVSNGALLFSDRVRRAQSILKPFLLQRQKDQVLSSLPKKTSRVVICELDPSQKRIYQEYERRFKGAKEKEQPQELRPSATGIASDQNNVWIQLRKAAIHAQIFRRYFKDETVAEMANILMRKVPQTELRQPNLSHLTNELKECSDMDLHLWCKDYPCIKKFDIPDGSWLKSGKVQALLELIEQFRENGDRALVFTRFSKVLNVLRECLASYNIPYLDLEGSTKVAERQELIDRFNDSDDIPVFLITTGSGGAGINLTGANKVVVFDQSDNPQDDVQAENRAHRLGQTRDVEVIRLISKDTIEELVYKACEQKLKLAKQVTGLGEDQNAAVEMSTKDMEKKVRKMLMEQTKATPPKSDDDNVSESSESE